MCETGSSSPSGPTRPTECSWALVLEWRFGATAAANALSLNKSAWKCQFATLTLDDSANALYTDVFGTLKPESWSELGDRGNSLTVGVLTWIMTKEVGSA